MSRFDKGQVMKLGAAVLASAAMVVCLNVLHTSVPSRQVAFATINEDGTRNVNIAYQNIEAPTPANENGVVTADEWEKIYPEIVASYRANEENTYRVSYLDEDESPYLVNIYEGYGFAKDYTSAIGHSYTLEDVHNTERPHPLANCLTCKTPDFTKLVNDMGVEVYQYDFEETYAQMNENISCYNCHENQAGKAGELVVTHSYVTKALGDEMSKIDSGVLSCGQCHIEYYFNPETKETTMPYGSVAAMSPSEILKYYDDMGYSDWTQESTGAHLLKAQHPEMETFLGQGSMHAGMGMNCADCHMAKTVSDKGVAYTSHKWESPLENQEILDTCVQCHGETDMTAKVRTIQEEITTRESEVGNRLADLNDTLAAAVSEGTFSEAALDEIRELYRDGQWFFDFCYVENSEGAHNSSLSRDCLDKAEKYIDEAMALLNGESADKAEMPVAANANGIITADEWEAVYPEIVASYRANEENTYRVSYLDEDQSPYLKNIYEGYGFAKDYTSAIGHSYTLEDVYNTERPHALANCLTCKTPDFTKLVNDMGEEAYQYDFEETHAQMNENISCYNCHENQAGNDGELVVTHSYVIKALGDEMANINPAVLSCGQCHIEYYFNPENKATSMPYDSVEAMDPEAILAYYDEIGFADWTQEATGTAMLKAQHPEMETYLGSGSIHAGMGLSCADCHMAKTTSENGVAYTSHKWESPLDNQEILDTCVKCHGETDMTEKIHAIQKEITEREAVLGNKLSELKDALAEAVASGNYTEEQLDEIRRLHRTAQWYFDFCYVENSEGAHNSTMSKRCLEQAEQFMDEAMTLLEL